MPNSSSIAIENESMVIVHSSDGTIFDVHHFVTAVCETSIPLWSL